MATEVALDDFAQIAYAEVTLEMCEVAVAEDDVFSWVDRSRTHGTDRISTRSLARVLLSHPSDRAGDFRFTATR